MEEEFGRLLEAARAGDERAIEAIYARHHARLLRVLRAEVGEAAEDVASQTWLEVVRQLARFRGDETGFRSLLYTIARRRVLDHRRHGRRHPADPVAVDSLSSHADAGPATDDAVVDRLAGDAAAARIVELLGPDLAEVVLLRVVAGLTPSEVAEVTGRAPGTVRVQLHRALRKLAEVLGAPGTGGDDA